MAQTINPCLTGVELVCSVTQTIDPRLTIDSGGEGLELATLAFINAWYPCLPVKSRANDHVI